MVKEFCLAWEKNKEKLEEYFRTTPQSEYDSYELLVRRLFDIVINPSIENDYYGFDKIRKDMMIMSYYKYGPMKENYDKFKCMDALGNIEKRIQKYKETGNTDFLADVANFAMIEFMYPSIEGARYTPTDTGACDIAGFSINEVRNFDK